MIRSAVKGIGRALPKRAMTNAEFEGVVDTTDEWIVQRTGIRQRYIADETETTASLGEAAARAALDNAGMTPDDIDLIVLATSTPDDTFPATATNGCRTASGHPVTGPPSTCRRCARASSMPSRPWPMRC